MTTEPEDRPSPGSLTELLDALRPHESQDQMSVHDMVERVGGRSFPAVILVPAVLLVSPLSGIPSVPTLGGLLITLIAAQALFGRKHLWLPGFLMRRSVSSRRMSKALDWLARPSSWMDRFSRPRWRPLSSKAAQPLTYLSVIVLAIGWPVLELLPFVTSFGAGAVSMMMFGLMTRDGAYLLAGYLQGAAIYLILVTLWSGLI